MATKFKKAVDVSTYQSKTSTSPKTRMFFRGSRSPTREDSKQNSEYNKKEKDLNIGTTERNDVNNVIKKDNLQGAFEMYEKLMGSILKTPPDSPKELDNTEDDEKENMIDEKLNPEFLPPDSEPTETINVEDIDFNSPFEGFCTHQNVIKEHSTTICEDCGMELYQEITHEQDWRYYGDQDSRNTSDPGRCQYRKCAEKGIKKDLEKLQFPPEICELADQFYLEVTQGDVKRNLLRKGIMLACVLDAYRIKEKTKTPDELQTKFGIDNKSMSQGISYYRMRCPRDRFQYEDIDAKHFIPEIMKKFQTKEDHINKVIMLYEKIKDACVVLHRSNPKSVSKALVYYYLRRKGCNIDPVKYGKIVSLSEAITIRLSSEISRVLGTQQTVNLF